MDLLIGIADCSKVILGQDTIPGTHTAIGSATPGTEFDFQ